MELSKVKYTLKNLTGSGLYFGTGNEIQFYAENARPSFFGQVNDSFSITYDGQEQTIASNFYDIYSIMLIANESFAADLAKLQAAKSVTIKYLNGNKELTADTTKTDFITIIFNKIEKTNFLKVEIQFRVFAFNVDFSIPENENYQLIISNTDYVSKLNIPIDSDFTSIFGQSASFYSAFRPLSDVSESEFDQVQSEFLQFASRASNKSIVNMPLYLNEANKNYVKKYFPLANSTVIVDKTQNKISLGAVSISSTTNKATGTNFLSLVSGQKIILNAEIYTILTIESDTSALIHETILADDSGDGDTYKYYRILEQKNPEITQITTDLYEVKISGIYKSNINYSL